MLSSIVEKQGSRTDIGQQLLTSAFSRDLNIGVTLATFKSLRKTPF